MRVSCAHQTRLFFPFTLKSIPFEFGTFRKYFPSITTKTSLVQKWKKGRILFLALYQRVFVSGALNPRV